MSSIVKKILRIIGSVITVIGMVAILVSVFTPIKCVGTALVVWGIGLCMLWSTEGAFRG